MKPFFVFSGQGAQSVGMGHDLADAFPAAAAVFRRADEVLGFALSKIIFEGPEEELTRTRFCQTAIYTTSCAALAAFRTRFPEVRPAACAGLSLGEYGALYAAGSFDFETGLNLLARRSELMEAACEKTSGGMASVIAGDPAVIAEVCADCGIDVANYNSPGQIVISGEKELLEKAVAELRARGMRKVIVLNVAGAFHSRLMKEAGAALSGVLEKTGLKLPDVPVYHNFTGAPAASVTELRADLAAQVAGSVRWEQCVRRAVADGADVMIEFGPGNVLTKLAGRTVPELKTFNVNGAAGLDGIVF